MELLSPEGLRIDGRRARELRAIKCAMGIFDRPDGSAYVQHGNTKVLASVYGPREVQRKSTADRSAAVVFCEYSMAAFSTGERKRRTKGDRRATEISLIIKQTFESAIMVELYPGSQIDIFLQVVQADGGTRCAAINAATLALIDAGIALSEFVCAIAVGCIDDTPVLDLNYVEDSSGRGPDVPVAIHAQSQKITMLQLDAKLPMNKFEPVLELALEGCMKVCKVLQEYVRRYACEHIEILGLTDSNTRKGAARTRRKDESGITNTVMM